MNDMLKSMSSTDNNNVFVCANCGKEGANNICNKCKKVKYCNAVCKKIHKKKHKKDCDEHVRLAAEKHDEKLFKQPPTLEDCPICFLRLPVTGIVYMECCGKIICAGCIHAPVYDNEGNKVDNQKCPFCRTPPPSSDEEIIKRYTKRKELNDSHATFNLGSFYDEGTMGLCQNRAKALELWHRAAELGETDACYSIGNYKQGRGVERNEKAIYYWELAAMGGHIFARNNLGVIEENEGKMDRALKHYMIAIKDGDSDSLKKVKGNVYGWTCNKR